MAMDAPATPIAVRLEIRSEAKEILRQYAKRQQQTPIMGANESRALSEWQTRPK
jgi:hypothetical protein